MNPTTKKAPSRCSATDALAYHYTTGYHIESIHQTGIIRRASALVYPPEKPVVWFSTNAVMEPTAVKSHVNFDATGRPDLRTARRMTMEEMVRDLAVYRLAVPVAGLLSWPELKKAARIPPKVAKALEDSAKKQGADPDDWLGSLDPVPLIRMIKVERLDSALHWHDVTADFNTWHFRHMA